MNKYFINICLLLAMISGCKTTPKNLYPHKPIAQILDCRVENPKLDYASMVYTIDVNNPNSHPLRLTSMNYSITSGSGIFLTGTAIESVVIPPHSHNTILVTDEVIYARLLKSLHATGDSNIPIQLKLWLRSDSLAKHPLEIIATHQGKLTLPDQVAIEVDGKVYNTVDVIYVTTPYDVIDRMLKLAQPQEKDLIYDLGCGDGRILIAAAQKYGCKGVGYDIDPARVTEAQALIIKHQVDHLVTIQQKDIFNVDFSKADIVAIYLTPELNARLIPQLKTLKPGARIISHSFGIHGIELDEVIKVYSHEDNREHTVYAWTTPLQAIAEAQLTETTP